MGYKKLDEIMELLTEELDGFNKSLDKLEKTDQECGQYRNKAGYFANHVFAQGTSGLGEGKEFQASRIR